MRVIQGITLSVLASAMMWGQAAPAHLEFEVASIRPSGPLVPGQLGIGLHIDGAQVRCNFLSITDYLDMAYKVKNYQVSGPDWLKSDRFDISAKLPEGATRAQVPEMIKTLLATRFQVKLHTEMKPLPVYALVAAKGGAKIT